MGLLYSPLAALLAIATAWIPFREYRALREVDARTASSPSRDLIALKLQNLRPEVRMYAWSLLGLALVVACSLFFLIGSKLDGLIAPVAMLSVISVCAFQLRIERRISKRSASTMARIIGFKKGRRSRSAIYEYEVDGISFKSTGGSLIGFSEGMKVPILYNTLQPAESRPVPDFIFYRIRAVQS